MKDLGYSQSRCKGRQMYTYVQVSCQSLRVVAFRLGSRIVIIR